MRFQHQRRGADEGEIPADTEHEQRCPEVRRGDARQPDHRGHRLQRQPKRDNARCAEPRDQRSGEKTRAIHRHDVPLDAEIGIADRQSAHLHGKRRRGHHQVHHRIGDHAAQRGGNEARLPGDFEQGAAAMQVRRRGLRRIDARQHRHRHQRDQRLHHKGEREQIRRPDVHGPLHELRPEHAGEHAASHHPGHRLGPERGAGAIGRREPIGLRDGAIESAEEGRAAEQPERGMQDRPGTERTGERAAEGADDEGDAATIGARDRAGRQRAGGQAEHIHRERHGGERHARRQRCADDRAGGEDHGRIGTSQRLRRREPPHIAARPRVIARLIRCCHVDHRHSRVEAPAGASNRRHYGERVQADQPAQTGVRHAGGARGWPTLSFRGSRSESPESIHPRSMRSNGFRARAKRRAPE